MKRATRNAVKMLLTNALCLHDELTPDDIQRTAKAANWTLKEVQAAANRLLAAPPDVVVAGRLCNEYDLALCTPVNRDRLLQTERALIAFLRSRTVEEAVPGIVYGGKCFALVDEAIRVLNWLLVTPYSHHG